MININHAFLYHVPQTHLLGTAYSCNSYTQWFLAFHTRNSSIQKRIALLRIYEVVWPLSIKQQ
jgi:hypothetical protein